MATRDQTAFSSRVAIKLSSSRQFSSTGRNFDDSRFEIGFILVRCGRSTARLAMTTNFVFREEGAIQVHSADGSSVFRSPGLLSSCAGIQHCPDLLGATGGRGGE